MRDMWYLYIIRNEDGRLYTGIATDVARRFGEHVEGEGGRWTCRNRPVDLLYVEEVGGKREAERREMQIKRWSRAKKEALIRGDLKELHRLSVSRD